MTSYSSSTCAQCPDGAPGRATAHFCKKHGNIKALCAELDEYLILAAASPHQQIEELDDNYRVRFNGEEMQFLRTDTLLLPIVNATVEEFSHYLLQRLLAASQGEALVEAQVCVASGPGQKGCASWRAMDEGIA